MKTIKLFALLLLVTITFNAQESENLYESGDIKLGIAALPLLDLGNGYSGIAAKPSISFYISERFAISTAAFALFPQDIEQDNGRDAEVQAYGFIPSWRLHAINSGKFSFYLESGLGIGAIRYKANDPADIAIEDNSGGILLLSAGAGINYKFAKCIELEFGVPYMYGLNITNAEDTKLFSGVAFNLGMNLVFNTRDIKKIKKKHQERLKKKWEDKE
ncbi:hypothetical protein [Aquimarina sp. 2201CG14-23]|uniref:hypothetical protein n=1 Tax=Aquimarina mycalae TaxID=3040073 RepID=UPI002477F91F|nr:hypothetical protein [Aquimarina sp. 2201CG14-23]MDH7446407.1 hypothetical protein [Aquimarina sp. 2201CG14-23]